MEKFYEGCSVCAFCGKDTCPERCFECARPDVTREDWIHSLGFYFPRFRKEHWDSNWSRGIAKAKKKFMPVISSFARIAAWYMDRQLAEMKPYLITGMPAYCSHEYLFSELEISPMQLLAHSVFANLKDRKWVDVKQILVQTQKKAKKQHTCKTDTQRKRNVQGIYTVQEPDNIKGKNIVLLDDVITSGATMRECADVLFEAGAEKVVGVVLARTFRIASDSRT